MVAVWNSRFVKQSSDLKTSSITLRCHWKPNCQWRSVTCGCFVDHQYSRFGGIPSAVANRYRKSASLLKRSVSITSISLPIKRVNIAFWSVPCIRDEWAILGDHISAASRRLVDASRRVIFYWNTATGPKYSNDRVILRPNVENKLLWYFYATYFLEHVECWSHCAITRLVPLPAVTIRTNQTKWRIAGMARCRGK